MSRHFVHLRLKELAHARGLKLIQISAMTGIKQDRLTQLGNDGWVQLKNAEIGKLCSVLHCTPAELFSVHQPDLFFGARSGGKVVIHVSSRWRTTSEEKEQDMLSLSINHWDIQAYKLIHEHARSLGIATEIRVRDPIWSALSPMPVEEIFPTDTHVVIGSSLTGQIAEYAVSAMYGHDPFDETQREHFPFNLCWETKRFVNSSFGFVPEHAPAPEGVWSNKKQEIVATRTRKIGGGVGSDCGIIAAYRILDGHDEDLGVPRERCIAVLCGNGGPGTLGCATALIEPDNTERLYPKDPGAPQMFAVQTKFNVVPPVEPSFTAFDNRKFQSAEIVDES